jgi:putative transposase
VSADCTATEVHSRIKHEAVALAPRSGRSAHQGAQEVGVSQTALRHWLREATRAASGPNGFPAGEARKALRREMERLRMERDLLKGGRLLRQRVARSSAVIQAEKAQDPVEVLGRVMAVARSGFYAGGQRPRSRRAQEPQAVRAQIRPSHQESDGRYGSPRMHRDRRPQGFPRSSRHRVARLLRLHGLRGGCRRRTTGRSPAVSSEVLAANVLPWQVTATQPHQTWAGDSTVVAPREGGLSVAVRFDWYAHRVVGWALEARIPTAVTHARHSRWRCPSGRSCGRCSITRIAAANIRRDNTTKDAHGTACRVP